MSAIFLQLGDNGIFKVAAGKSQSVIRSTLIDGLENAENLTIITSVAVSFNETIQFFQTFDDLIHYFYFGKGLGQFRFELMVFMDCEGFSSGLARLWGQIASHRGKLTQLDMATFRCEGILTSFTIVAQAEPQPHYLVSLELAMTDCTWTTLPDIKGLC